MDARLEFKNGDSFLTITPSDEWERLLLGAVAKGGDKLTAEVHYTPSGHFSYGKCEAVKVVLEAPRDKP